LALNPVFGHQPGKMFKRSVIGALSVIRKTTGGQLPAGQMIAETIAAIPFARAGFITAIAFFKIFFGFAFHRGLLIQYRFYM
jgi:hypothetical protein